MSFPRQWVSRIAVDASNLTPHLSAWARPLHQRHWRSGWGLWRCSGCRGDRSRSTRFAKHAFDHRAEWRHFSTAHRICDEYASRRSSPPTAGANAAPDDVDPTTAPSTTPGALPSHTEKQRSAVSKRMSRLMDSLLAHASVASQHINAYTGTDYSGIESLRRNIKQQEQEVRSCHASLDARKTSHHNAVAEQASAQREIVGLLERKSSWSPGDLERYMSLVRSEHVNDQAVQTAKDGLNAAERELEEARSLLERLERKQYHEEQIWSDTIRRNSTWVTFGLMGVNILLLLAQITIFEPYRRKKIVRDVKTALDEKTVTAASIGTESLGRDVVVAPITDADGVEQQSYSALDALLPPNTDVSKSPVIVARTEYGDASESGGALSSTEQHAVLHERPFVQQGVLATCRESLRDLFSERVVQMRRVDITSTALSGAATGAAVVGFVVMIIRQK